MIVESRHFHLAVGDGGHRWNFGVAAFRCFYRNGSGVAAGIGVVAQPFSLAAVVPFAVVADSNIHFRCWVDKPLGYLLDPFCRWAK